MTRPLPTPAPTFSFHPRWKEELVCTAAGGSFVLDLTMGVLNAYLPTQDVWQRNAPPWARPLWPVLRDELEAWCRERNINFVIDPTAHVFQPDASRSPAL